MAVDRRLLIMTLMCYVRTVFSAARFDPSGKHVFLGTTLGFVLVFNSRTKTVRYIHMAWSVTDKAHTLAQMVARHKILGGTSAIRGFEFTANGRYDKRVYHLIDY